MNELQVKVLNVTPAVVEFNFNEMLAYAKQLNAKYANLVFDEESVKEGKSTVAEIRKTQKSINDFKIKTKKELAEQVSLFEGQCKEIIAEFDGSVEFIQGQLDKYEETRRHNRRIEVQAFIDEALTVLPLEEKWRSQLILKDEWLNASLTNSKLKKAIMEDIEKLSAEQKSYYDKREVVNVKCELYSLKLSLAVALIPDNFYYLCDNYDGAAIDAKILDIAEKQSAAEKQAIENIRKQEEAKAQLAAQVEIEKAKSDAQAQVAEVLEVAATVAQSVEAFTPVERQEKEQMYKAAYNVRGSRAQLEALEKYMTASGIQFNKQ